MDVKKVNLDEDIYDFLEITMELRETDKEKYLEAKGLVKGILISTNSIKVCDS